MISEHYVWLTWASAFLLPWTALYLAFPVHRRTMLWASVFTAPFGLSEPLFVPEYWNPPSLFDLAQRTGFDIESLVFTFAIGGVAAVLYSVLTRADSRAVPAHEKHRPLHRHHYKALASPFIAFPLLYFLPWNPIYPGIVAMLIRAGAATGGRADRDAQSFERQQKPGVGISAACSAGTQHHTDARSVPVHRFNASCALCQSLPGCRIVTARSGVTVVMRTCPRPTGSASSRIPHRERR